MRNARKYGKGFADGGAVDEATRQKGTLYLKRRLGSKDVPWYDRPNAETVRGRIEAAGDQADYISNRVPRRGLETDADGVYRRTGYAGGGATSWQERASGRALAHEGMIKSPVPGRTDALPITVGGGAYILPADHLAAIGQGNSVAGGQIANQMLGLSKKGGLRMPRAIIHKQGRLKMKMAEGGRAFDDWVEAGPFSSSIDDRRFETEQQAVREAAQAAAKRTKRFTARKIINPTDFKSALDFAVGGSAPDVPIVAAGGEYVVSPEKVREIGGGDLDRGHQILDSWVLSTRKKHIKTLKSLKPPKK